VRAHPCGERQTGARPRDRETPPTENPETARFFFSAPRDVARLFRATVCSTCRGIEQRHLARCFRSTLIVPMAISDPGILRELVATEERTPEEVAREIERRLLARAARPAG
jgi:hypothetical protein